MLDILAGEQIEFSGGHILYPALGFITREHGQYSWVQSKVK